MLCVPQGPLGDGVLYNLRDSVMKMNIRLLLFTSEIMLWRETLFCSGIYNAETV